MKTSTRFLIINSILLVITFMVIAVIVNYGMCRQALHGAESKIKMIADQHYDIYSYFIKKIKPEILKLTESAASEESIDPVWISSMHAMREMTNDIAKRENGQYYVKIAAVNSPNPKNEAAPFEKNFISELIANPKLQDKSSIRVLDGITYFVYLRRGNVFEDSCIRCHRIAENASKDMNRFNGAQQDFIGKKAEHISAISIRTPLSIVYGDANRFILKLSIILIVILVTVICFISWLSRCYLYKPLLAMHNKALELSTFNDEIGNDIDYKKLEISTFHEKLVNNIALPACREFKELALAFNKILVKFVYHIDNVVNLLKQRTMELEEAIDQMKNEVSERKRKDEALRNANEFLDKLIKSSPLAILSFDTKRTVLSWNEAAEKMFGWQKSEVIGRNVPKLQEADEYGKRTLQGEVFTNIEVSILNKDGMPIDICFSSAPLRDSKGRITGAIAVVDDITERNKMQAELLKAQKLESLGVLAGGIAHDFNNVLTSVSGNIQLAKMRIKPETKIFELLSSAEKALIRAQKLSVRLLTFAKGGAPQKKVISIQNVIKYSCSIARQGSKAECEFLIPEDLWQIEADVGQIGLVISNIVTNAIQAYPDGGIIRVAARNFIMDDKQSLPMKPGRYLHVSIRDQGPGIPKEYLSKIFDPYFTTKVENSGLGLAASYSIITKHSGYIFVKSRPGAGTAFHIYLPAYGNAIPLKEGSGSNGQGNVLVMDDDIMLKKMMKEMMDVLGYKSDFAKNGNEAIEMYKKAMKSGNPYDAVMLDLTIPGGMGGREAVKELLEIDQQLKAIVCSGYSDDPVMSDHFKYGFKGMLPKPFNMKSLNKVLQEVIKN